MKSNTLVGVTQRDTQVYYQDLDKRLKEYKPLITSFFEEQIKGKFFDHNFVFDIYIDVPPNNKVWLIDFNPWIEKTDTGLFTWNEV